MKRFPDWETRLCAYLAPLRDKPFEWGTHDCCTFAAGAVEAMTGEDTIPEFRGAYSDQASADEALSKVGRGTLIRTMNAKFARVPVGHAHRGDIVMIKGGGLAIAMGDVAIQVGEIGQRQGLIRRQRADWIRAWSVPMPGAADV